MNLLCTLSSEDRLDTIFPYVDGVICGSYFSDRHYYSLSDMRYIAKRCKALSLDFYVLMDTMVKEEDIPLLYEYLYFLKDLDVDGIYFADLAVLEAGRELGIDKKMIYESDTLMTNSLDASFFLKKGLKSVVLAKEITLDEMMKIADNTKHRVDVHLFGYQKMSSSKRHFLTNYFNHLASPRDLKDNMNLRIIEETRNYSMPILENEYGTKIYSDYILCMYEESLLLADKINNGIIDDLFIDFDILMTVLKDYRKLNKDNATKLEEELKSKYHDVTFDKGYLYQKTNITK